MKRILWVKWGLALLTTPSMLAAYLVLAATNFPWLHEPVGFFFGYGLTTGIVCGLIGLLGRQLGLYQPQQFGAIPRAAARQGVTATELGLLFASFWFPAFGFEPGFWLFLLTFFAVSVIGRETFVLVSRSPEVTV